MHFYQHETSVIDEGAMIGAGTKVWHFCHVMASAVIGDQCILGQNVFVGAKVVLRNRVKVQNNVSLYEGVVCEDDVFVGPSVVFTNILTPRAFIERKGAFKKTIVERGASIGANATIVCGITIGAFALIGAGAVVTKDVLPFSLMVGNPAVQKGWVSECGEKLYFDKSGQATCITTNVHYRLIEGRVHKMS
jgi:UDP-2-acetamido-3-amino-2,3-dideoxy-glucuronate N-acetyltransferase